MLSEVILRDAKITMERVLILIILEDALWGTVFKKNMLCRIVLILIILEDALWVGTEEQYAEFYKGLNPYYTGRCSLRRNVKSIYLTIAVLILIILEDALWVWRL